MLGGAGRSNQRVTITCPIGILIIL